MDYADITDLTKEFVVLRHDIEFSIERAYDLACIEHRMGIASSYLVQLTNNTYNALSQENIEMLKQMIFMGHHVGLHYHMKEGMNDANSIKDDILFETQILERFLDKKIDRFSLHRPSSSLLRDGISIKGLLNLYDRKYFTFCEDVDALKENHIKYISDSRHRWNYGFPDDKTLMENDKVQLLIHPYSWTKAGLDNAENFADLSRLKIQTLWNTMDSECKHFSEIKNQLTLQSFLVE